MTAHFQRKKREALALLAVGIVLIPQVFLSCNVETAGTAIRFHTAVQGAIDDGQAVAAFETAKGWTVELGSAHAVFGPIYFYGGAHHRGY